MKCERCGDKHDGSYVSGRFCSKRCSHTREQTAESNRKRSEALRGHHNNRGQIPWNKGKKIPLEKRRKSNYRSPNKIPIDEILAGKHPRMRSYTVRNKLLAEGIIKDGCDRCEWLEKRDGYLWSTCHLHHKDGDHSNHRLDNLELLCPNCHSVTPSYCKSKKTVGKSPVRTFDERGKVVFR